MTLVTVTVNGTDYKAVCGTNLGEVLAEHQLAEMPCGGKGRCGKCRVTAQGKLSPLSDAERRLLTKEEIGQGVRLACRTVVEGNCSVTLSGSSSIQVLADGEIPLSSLRPDFSSYGVAVDIGTTTLAARLYDINGRLLAESGRLNPQTSWGADVISRIDAAMKGADKAISVVTCDAVSVLVTELADKARIQANEVDGMVITGNTVMLHLLTGTCAEPLSHAPFEAGRLFGETITAGELGILALSPDTEIYLPRCAAAFVGRIRLLHCWQEISAARPTPVFWWISAQTGRWRSGMRTV